MRNLLIHKVDWKRPVMANDASGKDYPTGDYTTKQESLRCCVQPAAAAEVQFYYQRGMDITHAVYTDQVEDYRLDDRLFFGARELRVIGVTNAIERNIVIKIDCTEVASTAKRF